MSVQQRCDKCGALIPYSGFITRTFEIDQDNDIELQITYKTKYPIRTADICNECHLEYMNKLKSKL